MKEMRKNKNFNMYACVAQSKLHFTEYVYNRRRELKMSQIKLAEKAETSQKTISRIENAKYNNPSFDLVERIKYVLREKIEKK